MQRAVHTVEGISAKELLHRFWDTDVRLEWELTIETCKVCEVCSTITNYSINIF